MASKTRNSGAEVAAGMSVMAMPIISAKNIRWSMFGVSDARAFTGLDGTTVLTTCMSGESVPVPALLAASTVLVAWVLYFCWSAVAVAGSMRLPGRIVLANFSPIATEIAERTRV